MGQTMQNNEAGNETPAAGQEVQIEGLAEYASLISRVSKELDTYFSMRKLG